MNRLRHDARDNGDRDALWGAALALVSLLLLLLLPFAGGGCSREAQSRPTSPAAGAAGEPRPAAAAPAATGAPAPARAANVAVEPAAEDALVETVTLTGTATPRREVTLAAEAAGRVESVSVDVGAAVTDGAVVARVDYAMLRARLRQARADRTLAQRTLGRLEKLHATQAVPGQAIDEARARAEQAAAAERIARVALDQATVRAPLAGVVIRRHVEPGEYVTAGQAVLDVVDLSGVLVRVPLPETLAPRVAAGSAVRVRIDALDEERDGTVAVLVPTADRASGTFELRVAVDNADGRVLGGMAATVTLVTASHHGVVVPRDAIVQGAAGPDVFVARADGTAERRAVRLGAGAGERVVVADGLTPGEALVVAGQRGLANGQPVRVVR